MNISRKTLAWTLGALVAVGGGATAAAAVTPLMSPPAAVKIVETPTALPPTPTSTPTSTPTVAPAIEEPPVEVAPPAPEQPYSNSGQTVPFYPSSDPENASGGEYADPGTWCTSGSASTINGEPVCD